MTSFLRRLLFPVPVLALLAISPRPASALTQNYCSFPAALATFTYNGNAFEADNSVIRLTTATANEASSAFLTVPIALTATTSFHAFFRFQMGPTAAGGDGVAFVMQNSAAGAAALGGTTGNLGYSGITPSVDIKFDTFKNGANDASANFVAIETNGSVALPAAGWSAVPAFTMAGGGILNAWVDYVPGTISVYLSQTTTKPALPLVSHALTMTTQVGAQMYVGFTSSTGPNAQINEHDIFELELSTDGIPCACEGDTACAGIAATPACATSGICATCTATNHTACTGATPVCNVSVNTCVGCLANSDCSGGTPICDKTTLTCRACSSASVPADCASPTGQCDTLAGSANLGKCVVCVGDANCPPTTPRCSLAVNTCVQCLSGTDCVSTPNTPVCNAGLCKACASDANCGGATPACEVWGACGQCSATNGTACNGGTAVCDFPTGKCVACEFDSDCTGTTPTCDTGTHMCRACLNNADCVGAPSGPACATSGTNLGSCVACQADADCTSPGTLKCNTTTNTCVACLTSADCSGATPVCNTAAMQCVACLTNADCSGATPVCNGSNLCVGCLTNASCSGATPVCDTSAQTCSACQNDYAMSNPGPLSCPTAALPACQPAGSPLAGQCALCSSLNNSACATLPATPVCITATATCGCVKDTDCNPDSYCNTSGVSSGVCTTGCRVMGGLDNCSTGKYCTKTDGTVGTCMSEPCNSNTDCTGALPVCDTIDQPHVCVACLNASDCMNAQVCDSTYHCVECTVTPKQTKNCSPAGKGAICLAGETCGCATDTDCGDAMSGRICDATMHVCATGCRGTGGNGCAPPQTCSSGDGTPGTCQSATSSSSSSSSSSGGGGAGTGGGSASNGGGGGAASVISQAKGCGCRVAGDGDGDNDAPAGALAALLATLGAALLRGRPSRGKRR